MTGGENILTIKQLMEEEPLTDEFSVNKPQISQELKTLILIEHQNTSFKSGERVYHATNAQEQIAKKASDRKWHLLMKHRHAKSFALEELTYQEFRKLYTKDLPREHSLAKDVTEAVRSAIKALKQEK